ncbi:NAD(P)H-dependent flavin oxidoreductase [Ferruginivarius sediminum]|uniref:Nitronate monooxygenase n=1 Tax=Ferruginivarius sediminum TaxID=2661937 RepID=A0A369T6R1_9PROT|nr:nitronate monooxygenase [Ferruginivarius sediminum]RDD61013.1 nitronate monooxygenase [Ferruginivarius sediminum]
MASSSGGVWDTPVTRLLDCELPIVLAPMGAVSGGGLAAAVAQAGGCGLLGPGYLDETWIEREFDNAGNAPVGIGFITWHLSRYPERLDAALARKPSAVMLSFGDASPFAARIKDAGARLIMQVQTVADAERAAELGADLIVAQGTEAGGHGASRGTFALVPAVADAVAPVPVMAAGGVADGRGMAASFMLGAAGVLVGTRLFATREALGHANVKARLAQARGDETLRTQIFDIIRGIDWPSGYTGRAVRNDFAARWDGREDELLTAVEEERPRFQAAVEAGDTDGGLVWASESVDLIREVEPAGEVVRRMADEAARLLGQGAPLR